jgi:hypothetical protein
MPYHIVKSGSGYKVSNKNSGKTYSKKPMSKSKAKKQLAALHINTNESMEARIDQILESMDCCCQCGCTIEGKYYYPDNNEPCCGACYKKM